MKLARKLIALFLAVFHVFTYSASAQQVMNLQNGSTTQVESIQVNQGDSLTINVLNELGEVCSDCRAILETNGLLNNGAIDIWGILAIISPSIINNGVITVQGDLLLSNLGINKEAFFAGMAELSKDSTHANGFILNTGEIRNLTQGLLVMVAANGGIHNLGTISSNGGVVALVAGDKVSFPLTRDGVLNITLDGVTGVKGQVFDKDGNLVETKGFVTNEGLIQANGGAVVLQASGAEQIFDSIINHTGIIEAKSIAQENGKIILKSDTGNIHIDNAKMDASGLNGNEKGGSIQILTKGNIVIDGKTVVDASGDHGGGKILIGGDVHGTSSVTAANIGIGSEVQVKADAITNGSGGKIIVWSEGSTLAYGSFSAQGGTQNGNGGFIETSGKEYLDVQGVEINASAANGAAGTWLLDPRNVTISNSNTTNLPGAPGAGPWTFTPVSNNSNVRVSDITGKLNAGTNVTITTGSTGTQNGNITVSNAISKTAGGTATLTLSAAGNILINSAVTATVGALNLVFNAGGNINVSQAMSVNGGTVQMQAGGSVTGTNNQAFDVKAGNVSVSAGTGIDLEVDAGTIAFNNTLSGNVSIEDLSGGLTVGTVGSIIGGRNNSGNITILTHSPLTVAANIAALSGGNISLHALGNASADDLTINSGVTISSTSGNGNILLTSGDDISLGANAVVRTTGTGAVTAAAGENYSDATLNFDGNGNGTVLMDNGSAFRSEDGNITVNARDSVRIAEVNADGDSDNNRGDIFIEARNGYISDRNGGSVNLIGDHAVLNADQGIGDTVVADDDEIETNLNTLDVINSVSGHLNIVEIAAGGALGIVRAFQDNGGDLNIRTMDGSLTVNAGGSGVRATSGRMHLEANGNNSDLVINSAVSSTTGKIELATGIRDILIGAAGDITSSSGEIQVDSLNSITMANGAVFSTSNLIDLDAANSITLGSLQTTSNNSNAVTVVSRNGAILDGGDANVNIRTGTNGGAHLVAKTSIGSSNGLETQVGQLAAKTETGNIQIFNQGNLNITSLTDPDTSYQTGFTGGTTNGVQITDPSNLNTGNNFIWVTNNGNLNVNSNITNNDGGNVSVYSFGTVGTGNMNVNADIQSIGKNGDMRIASGGSMTMAAGTAISTQGNGTTSGQGNIVVGAGFNVSGKAADASITINPNLSLPLTAQSLIDPSTSLLNTVRDANANLTMNELSRIFTENGNILTDVQNAFTIGRVDADGNNDGNPLADHGISDGVRGNIVSLSRHGSTLDAEGPGEVGNLDYIAEALTLLSGGTIGLPTNKIEIDAKTSNIFAIGNIVVTGLGGPQFGSVGNSGAAGVGALIASLLGLANIESQLHAKAFSRALRPYSDFDGNYASDFPGYHQYEDLAVSTAGLDIDTSAIDQVDMRGVTAAPKAVEIPVSSETGMPLQVIDAQEPVPPMVVLIPGNAVSSNEAKTLEGVPETPAAVN